MKKTQKTIRLKHNIEFCATCQKATFKKELDNNAQFRWYKFKRICDRCAEKINL